jgi:hypothetical protein
MLVTEAAGCSTADATANGAVFAEVQAAAALALNRSATATCNAPPPDPSPACSTLRTVDDVIAVGRGLCEATQRLQDMSVPANSARLLETIAWVITVAHNFGATDDQLLDTRL